MNHLLEADTTSSIANEPTSSNMQVGLDLEVLEEGHFYRTRMGTIVQIVGEVLPGSKWYEHGFRHIDHRGSYYTEHGSTNSTIWQLADLIEEVDLMALTDEEMALFHDQSMARIASMIRWEKVHNFLGKFNPF